MRISFAKTSIVLIAATCLGAPAFAAGCSKAPSSEWQPKEKLQTKLEADGLKVKRIKTEGGCYEVYATDSKGHRQNMAYNAQTLQKLDDPEAGER